MPGSLMELIGDDNGNDKQNDNEKWMEIRTSSRYLDFHLEHSQGKLFQYVNAHVNDYAQVMTTANAMHDDDSICSSTGSDS